MLFQVQHSLEENEFTLRYGSDMMFGPHIHRSYEVLIQLHGATEVCIEDQSYLLSCNEAILIFPFQKHSYYYKQKGDFVLCLFSPDLVPDFYQKTQSLLPTDHRFPFFLDKKLALNNAFLKRAFVYELCGSFDQNSTYRPKTRKESDSILTELLLYAEKNFLSKCLLRDAASTIGYDYAYISKFFKQKTGISFRQYVNTLRIRESQRLLRNTKKSISDIKDECGFSCLRTFDREFIESTGMTPSEYRKQIRG